MGGTYSAARYYDSPDVLNEPSYQPIPEKALLGAVFSRALRDALGGQYVSPEDRRLARAWFMSAEDEPFSFVWVAKHLDLCPLVLRKLVLAVREEKIIDFDREFYERARNKKASEAKETRWQKARGTKALRR